MNNDGATGVLARPDAPAGRARTPPLHEQIFPHRIEFLFAMNKLTFAVAIALACFVPVYAQTVSEKAREIHNSAIVIDTHADTPQRFLDENYDIGSTDPKDPGHISLDKAKAGNLGAEFFSIWVEPETNQGHFARHTLDLIDSVYEQAARYPDRMMMAFSVDDIERAHREHKLAALLGIEGGHSIENDIRLLRDFYRLGVRYMTLSWSNTNEWADSSGDIDNPKSRAPQRPHRGGKADRRRDEPAGHAGRYFARRRQDVL
jgi:membrane dipeptidase